MPPIKLVAVTTAILMCGCSSGTEAGRVGAGSVNQAGSADLASTGGPAPAALEMRGNETQPARASDSASSLETSIPADGDRLTASPENLVLNFRTPVRLQEITVVGSDGQAMAMMVRAAGLSRSFSIPMPELEPGSYTVRWRALDDAGRMHEGSLGFLIT